MDAASHRKPQMACNSKNGRNSEYYGNGKWNNKDMQGNSKIISIRMGEDL